MINGQRARPLDGQAVAFAQFNAFWGQERDPLVDVKRSVASDVDTAVDGHIFRHPVWPRQQCRGVGGDGIVICHDEGKGLSASVVALASNGERVIAIINHRVWADGKCIVNILIER